MNSEFMRLLTCKSFILLSCTLIYLLPAFAGAQNKKGKHDLKLWYNKPAEHFEESLVLGNGKLGGAVFGGVETDKIYLNDATLWSGEPVDANMNPDAYTYVPAVREALSNENYELADSLIRNMQGSFSESYAPLGTMFINMEHKGGHTNYYRELDIGNATSITNYSVGKVHFEREYFISAPQQIMAVKLSASKSKALNFSIQFESLLPFKSKNDNNILAVNGYAPYHAEPSYRGDIPNAVMFDEDRGMRFSSYFKISETDGVVSFTDSSIIVKDASKATLLISIATSFNGFKKDPVTQGLDNSLIASKQIVNAEKMKFKELKKSHLKDYRSYFDRVSLNLGTSSIPSTPTNERLRKYSEGGEDTNLEELYFQYGRYLLISGSRTSGVPMNLQGIWNPYIRPPWSSNYTTNINVETNYWMAENTNLSEFHAPLLSWIENIAQTGEVTAKTFFGVDGWTACHNSDIWAMSNPVGDFGKGHPSWASWFMGGAWLSTHVLEHYSFTQDKAFLKRTYPVIKGAAEFCLQWLVEGKSGKLLTSPGTSPENRFFTPTGYKGSTLYGSTADIAMIRELFIQTIKACEVLELDTQFKTRMSEALSRLQEYKVGAKGNLQEWFHDWEDVDKEHRHQTHLFGLFPGRHISFKDSVLANACRKTLELRGPNGMGWSYGWRICLWSRLHDGEEAHKVLRSLLNYVEPTGVRPKRGISGGTYPNLFSAAPPLQIDGNFSGGAGIAEMLLQSSENEIIILPALPLIWSSGSFKGLCARGGFEVSTEWKNNKAVKTTILAKVDGKTRLVNGDLEIDIELDKGQSKTIKW